MSESKKQEVKLEIAATARKRAGVKSALKMGIKSK